MTDLCWTCPICGISYRVSRDATLIGCGACGRESPGPGHISGSRVHDDLTVFNGGENGAH